MSNYLLDLKLVSASNDLLELNILEVTALPDSKVSKSSEHPMPKVRDDE
jgi:hypothetical protein